MGKHLDPIWKDAAAKWAQQADAKSVVWEQKKCLDENWKPGPDFKECEAQGIDSFPTVRFFAPGSKTGDEYMLDRTPESLVNFAKTGIHPSPNVLPRAPGDESDLKLIDFYSAACPHCKHLDPVWEDTHKQWEKVANGPQRDELPYVQFEKKECYDDHWQPGKDIDLCRKFNVHAFPSIKLMAPDPNGHGFAPVDYTGPRTSEAMMYFLKTKIGMTPEVAAPAAAAPTPDAAHHDIGSAGAQEAHAAAPTIKLAPGVDPDEGLARLQAAVAKINSIAANAEEMAKQSIQDAAKVGDSLKDAQNTLHDAAAIGNGLKDVGADMPKALQESQAALKTAAVPLPLLSMSCLPIRKSSRSQSREASLQDPPGASCEFL